MTASPTLFYSRRSATAVVVRDGVIESVGPAALSSYADSRQIVEIGEGTLVPAFRDGHAHPLWAGQTLQGPPVGTAQTVEELLLVIADYASARPRDEWLVGAGYDPSLLPGVVRHSY